MNRAKCALGIIAVVFVAILSSAQEKENSNKQTMPERPITEISADLGSCSVEFRVTDLAGNPIYDAKIRTQIRYGFMGKRKLDLEAGTNSDGLARFVKMPNQVRAPLVFEGTHGSDTMIMTWDPGTNCDAEYPMILRKNPAKNESTQE